MYDKFGNIGDNCPDGILDTFASTLLDVAGRKALTEIQMSEMARSFDYLNKDVKMMEIFESQGRTKISSIESHASPGITPEESLKTIKFLVNMFVELRSVPF